MTTTAEIGTQECWARIDGARMRYLRCGSGPPLVLIHGLLGYSFSWRFNLPELGRLHTCYAVDLLGVGLSDRPAGLDCSLRATALRLVQFMDEVGIASADVLGTSHGGAVAMVLAAEAPERVSRLILVAPANPWAVYPRWLLKTVCSPAGPVLLSNLARLPAFRRLVINRLYGDVSRIPPGTLDGYWAAAKLPGTVEYGVKIARCWEDDLARLPEVLPRVAQLPALLIWGSRDPAVPLASAHELRRVLKNAELVVIQGAGHLPYEEAPAEFNRALAGFMMRESPAARVEVISAT
jgi:pimeloyl-ACP methyl ester carboxylesterase